MTLARTLTASVLVFGAVCCVISIAHIALGPAAIPGALPVNPTMDSEDRFYATLFLGFGLALMWCACDLQQRSQTFAFLLMIFFAGGCARMVSAAMVGLPSTLFIALGMLELLLPPLLWAFHRATRDD